MRQVKRPLLASCLLPTFLGAQGAASASLLEITPDTRSAGMVDIGLAITDNGSTATLYNTSTIAFSQDMMGTSYSYADISKDFGMHSASLFYHIGWEGKHGFSIGFRHYKNADFHWQDGTEDRARTWNVEAVYSRSVTRNLSLSLALGYLQVKTHKDANNKGLVSAGLGVSHHHNMGVLDEVASWTIGFQTANLGSKLDGQKLPARLGLGGVTGLSFSMDSRLQVVLDFSYLLPSKYHHLQADIGAEYSFPKYRIIHGGYRFGDNDKGTGNYGTLGYGINFWSTRTDFSYVLVDRDCLIHKIWQLGIGIIF